MKTVKQVARLTGVSVRTLHHYDSIGLLRPACVTGAGYRMYGQKELARLHHILFLRELEFPLSEIRRILDDPSFDKQKVLLEHKKLLTLKRDRLNRLIELAGSVAKGEDNMNFGAFDTTEIEKAKKQYGAEAKERWGGSAAYAESEQKTKNYTKEDWRRIKQESDGIFREFAQQMGKGPAHPDVRQTVKKWRHHITMNYYNCTEEILAGLGEMYAADERFQKNIDAHAEGLAQFMSAAIKEYCKK
ncbi:MerR family transcriptional regulator [Christensenellaceae bacterium OttesenSCG-928-K19]|nr:MerR family transcriptional regulator [Christensenellaceae bacterium OttesenSCG-928-K19]